MTDRHQEPEPATPYVQELGPRLTDLATSAEDRDCLETFAQALDNKYEAVWPLLLTVVVEPLAGAQMVMVGHVRPGMTFQLDADLQLRLIRPWFPSGEDNG